MAKNRKERNIRGPGLGAGIRVPDQPPQSARQNPSPTLRADVDGGRLMRDTDSLTRKDYVERLEELRAVTNKGWVSRWKDIRDNIMPERGLFEGEQPNTGEVSFKKVLDTRVRKYNANLAAMMQAGMTSPARAWFRLGVPYPELERRHKVKLYLSECEKIMYQAYRRSNFYDSVHTVYLESSGFGTNVLYGEENYSRLLSYRAFTIGEYYLDTNSTGEVDTLYRVVPMTARQVGQKFQKSRMSTTLQNALEKTPGAYFKALHVICPRRDYDRNRLDSLSMPFKSVWIELDTQNQDTGLLGEGGYMEKPFMAARWDVVGANVYGIGPGWYTLPEIKSLYQGRADYMKAVHKMIDPPMLVPPEYRDRIVHLPGGQNYGDEQIKPLYQITPDIPAIIQVNNDCREAIKEGFFNDLFIFLMNNPDSTATEILARQEEKMLLLGPIIERLENDFFDPCVARHFAVLNRSGMLPPAPEELRGVELRIDYISQLAMAQKEVGTRSIQKTVTFGLELSKFNPEIMDKLDLDQALDEFHELTGSPPTIVRPDEQVQGIRVQRAQAVQAQAKAQQALEMAKIMPQAAQTLSQTPVASGGTALDSIMGAGNPPLTEPLGPPAGPRPFGLPG